VLPVFGDEGRDVSTLAAGALSQLLQYATLHELATG
jgi:hypothetical protein